MGIDGLSSSTPLLLAGLLLDAIFGDPQVPFHPIRLIGQTLTRCEKLLRRIGWDGHAGGCVLFLMLAVVWVVAPCLILLRLHNWHSGVAAAFHILLVYIFFALRDLVKHIRAVQMAARRNDLSETRKAIGLLVGRDTDRMNLEACRRAAIESLSENFVDGFLSALFWYALLGLPGLLLFKVVSTMDSMVGYKTPLYLRFGWCGARLDDLMNYIPARMAWLILGLCALPFPGLSAGKGWQIGLRQHAVLPGPNPGWSEATMAGVLQRRLIGPVWKDGALVTTVWLGDAADPEAGTDRDITSALSVIFSASLLSTALGALSVMGLQTLH